MKLHLSNQILAPASLPILLFLFFASSGCIDLAPQHDPTRIFVLNGDQASIPPAGQAGLKVKISRIELPSYLNNSKMAARKGGLEITYSEFNRWGEDLDAAIGRNLLNALSANPDVSQATLFPAGEGGEFDIRVTVRIQRFEGENDNAAILKAQWEIADFNTREIIQTGKTNARRPWDGKDYATLAQGLSDTLNELGRDLSIALQDAGK